VSHYIFFSGFFTSIAESHSAASFVVHWLLWVLLTLYACVRVVRMLGAGFRLFAFSLTTLLYFVLLFYSRVVAGGTPRIVAAAVVLELVLATPFSVVLKFGLVLAVVLVVGVVFLGATNESCSVELPFRMESQTVKVSVPGGAEFREKTVAVPTGIMAELSRQCGGNVHDKGVVAVPSSTPRWTRDDYAAKNAADVRNVYSSFWSAGHSSREFIEHAPNNWICYDFKDRRIVPTDYAIRSAWVEGQATGSNLRNWVVETSMDDRRWIVIDHQQNSSELNGSMKAATFKVQKRVQCRFIRLTNIGATARGDNYLHLSAWEIFGTLIQ
jgi:hypothetical protein